MTRDIYLLDRTHPHHREWVENDEGYEQIDETETP